MTKYLSPSPGRNLHEISTLGLAHVGDAVFELMARTWLCCGGASTAKRLHQGAVGLVSAKAQAKSARLLMPELSEEERSVLKRGRNAYVNSVPKAAGVEDYHYATGLEALFGYLYLRGRTERIEELFARIVGGGDDAQDIERG